MTIVSQVNDVAHCSRFGFFLNSVFYNVCALANLNPKKYVLQFYYANIPSHHKPLQP